MKRITVICRLLGLAWMIAGLLASERSAANATGPPHAPAAAAQCSDVIENGSFETGDLAYWITIGDPWVADHLSLDGSFSAVVGGADNRDDTLYQDLELPAGADAATLTYWWYIYTEEGIGTPYDHLYVEVRDPGGEVLAMLEHLSSVSPAQSWFQSSFDLLDFAGQAVQIAFHGTTDASAFTSFHIDQVVLEVCAEPTPTEPPPCPGDDYEPNDNFHEAAGIATEEEHSAYICPSGDQDWFQFFVQPGQEIAVELYGLYGDLPADFDLYLYDPWENQVGESTAGGNAAEHIPHAAEEEGEYRVQVIGYGGAFSSLYPYQLLVTLREEPTPSPTATPTHTPTATPTRTSTPEPTRTATPVPGFVLRRAVFGSAGAEASGSRYRLRSTFGQGSPIGEGRSRSFRLRGGFWHAAGEVTLPPLTAVAEVSPGQGGTLVAPDGRVDVAFPPAAVGESVTVTYTQRLTPAMYTGRLLFAGNAFAVQATTASGQAVTQFERPFTLTLRYTDADWQQPGVLAEGSLSLYHWNAASSQWTMVPPVSHDTTANVWVGSQDHLSEFAWLGVAIGEGHNVYLPVIIKGQ